MKILQSNNNTKHFCNILRSGGAAPGPAFSSPVGAWVRGWVGEGEEGVTHEGLGGWGVHVEVVLSSCVSPLKSSSALNWMNSVSVITFYRAWLPV